MNELDRSLLKLILLRWGLVCFVVASAALVLPGEGPQSGFLLPFFLVVSVLTAVYLLLWRYLSKQESLYQIQFFTDFALLSVLLYFSGGLDSLFIPLYVLIIVYASLMKGRRGGVMALVFSLLSYLSIVHLGYLGAIPGTVAAGSYRNTLYQVSTNLLAFTSVAFLGIYLSERLSTARRELGVAKVVQENIIDSLRSGLITLDLQGRVSFCNRVGASILRCDRDALSGRLLSDFCAPRVLETILENDFQESPRALRIESWTKTEDGSEVYLGFGCSPLLSQEQRRVGYIVSFQDLTEIKKREEEFQFKEKMAAIGEMAAGLAHELRNPLGSLSGSIQILKSELQLSDDQSRLLEIVLRESERLNRIVGNFLDYAGPRAAALQPIDLATLLQETAQLFRNSPEFQENRHLLKLEIPSGGTYCLGNADQLRQVLWNVVQNAMRAMPDGGTLTMSLSRNAGKAVMGVADTGIGMNAAEQEKLFQPFHSGFRKGAGLGMALVYQIVREHEGEIQVSSVKGEGTRIDISLPEAKPARGRMSPKSKVQSPKSKD